MNECLEADFIKTGCKNRRNVAIAVQVYLELCEVKRYWDVEYFYNTALEKICFTARKTKSENPSIFVPIAVSETISFRGLQQILELDCNVENYNIYIAIVHSDSTCIYYQITDGLGPPPAAVSKAVKDDKSQKLDADLKKNRELLEQAALYGIQITLSKKETPEAGTSSTQT